MRFLVDSMLGRLAKWLRILGYDTIYLERCVDRELIELAQREGRIILTRDRHLTRDWTVKTFLIKSDLVDEQLREVTRRFDLDTQNLFSRCPICNLGLIKIKKDVIKDKIPEFVYKTYDEFWNCKHCGRYYWPGTHWESIKKKVHDLLLIND